MLRDDWTEQWLNQFAGWMSETTHRAAPLRDISWIAHVIIHCPFFSGKPGTCLNPWSGLTDAGKHSRPKSGMKLFVFLCIREQAMRYWSAHILINRNKWLAVSIGISGRRESEKTHRMSKRENEKEGKSEREWLLIVSCCLPEQSNANGLYTCLRTASSFNHKRPGDHPTLCLILLTMAHR